MVYVTNFGNSRVFFLKIGGYLTWDLVLKFIPVDWSFRFFNEGPVSGGLDNDCWDLHNAGVIRE